MSRPILTIKRHTTETRVKHFPEPEPTPSPGADPTGSTQTIPLERMQACRTWVRETAPTNYPFVVGIREQLLERKPDDLPERGICVALMEIVRSIPYLGAFELATHRHGLDGETTEIPEGHRQFSAGRMFERRQKGVCHE